MIMANKTIIDQSPPEVLEAWGEFLKACINADYIVSREDMGTHRETIYICESNKGENNVV